MKFCSITILEERLKSALCSLLSENGLHGGLDMSWTFVPGAAGIESLDVRMFFNQESALLLKQSWDQIEKEKNSI